jgi:hypothetical protein
MLRRGYYIDDLLQGHKAAVVIIFGEGLADFILEVLGIFIDILDLYYSIVETIWFCRDWLRLCKL